MKLKNILLIGLALSLAALPSCKKDDDDDTTKDYQSGTLTFTTIPGFVNREETFTLTPSGITDPEEVGYYWYTSWDETKDTTKTETGTGDGSYTVTVPYDLGQYSINCVSFATDYYTSAASVTFYVVSPDLETTITNQDLAKNSTKITDARDGKNYYACAYAGKAWMKNNLGYSGSGISYYSSTIMDSIFGKYYTWSEAQTACPDGWRLPSDSDFAALANQLSGAGESFKALDRFTGVAGGMMVNASFLDELMWEYWPQVKITNASGFCSIPTGYVIDQDGAYRYVGIENYAVYWTSDSDGDEGYYRYIYVDKPDVMVGKGDKESFRASVRCIKDDVSDIVKR